MNNSFPAAMALSLRSLRWGFILLTLACNATTWSTKSQYATKVLNTIDGNGGKGTSWSTAATPCQTVDRVLGAPDSKQKCTDHDFTFHNQACECNAYMDQRPFPKHKESPTSHASVLGILRVLDLQFGTPGIAEGVTVHLQDYSEAFTPVTFFLKLGTPKSGGGYTWQPAGSATAAKGNKVKLSALFDQPPSANQMTGAVRLEWRNIAYYNSNGFDGSDQVMIDAVELHTYDGSFCGTGSYNTGKASCAPLSSVSPKVTCGLNAAFDKATGKCVECLTSPSTDGCITKCAGDKSSAPLAELVAVDSSDLFPQPQSMSPPTDGPSKLSGAKVAALELESLHQTSEVDLLAADASTVTITARALICTNCSH